MYYSIVRPTTKYYKNKIGYRYYKYNTWTQLALTSNNSYGTVTGSEEASASHSFYHALDGDTSTWWEVGANLTSGYLQWVLPQEIIVKGLTIMVRTGDRPNITVRCYTSSSKTTPVGDSVTTTTAGETKVVSGIPANGVQTNTLYFDCSSTQNYFGISEISVNAVLPTYKEVTSSNDYDFTESYTYVEEVSSNDDYDFTKEVLTPYLIIRPATKYYKNKIGYRYYKYDTWTQPVLSADGTMGGDSFATSASAWNLVSSGSIAQPYAAFDKNTSTYWRSGTTSGWLQFYNPSPIKVSTIKWGYFYNYPTGGNVQGSNDGNAWTTLANWTNSSASDFTIQVNSNAFYKYYRINITGVNTDVIHCLEFTINAILSTYKEVTSSDDYDFTESYSYAEEVTSTDDYDFTKEVLMPYLMVKDGE